MLLRCCCHCGFCQGKNFCWGFLRTSLAADRGGSEGCLEEQLVWNGARSGGCIQAGGLPCPSGSWLGRFSPAGGGHGCREAHWEILSSAGAETVGSRLYETLFVIYNHKNMNTIKSRAGYKLVDAVLTMEEPGRAKGSRSSAWSPTCVAPSSSARGRTMRDRLSGEPRRGWPLLQPTFLCPSGSARHGPGGAGRKESQCFQLWPSGAGGKSAQ